MLYHRAYRYFAASFREFPRIRWLSFRRAVSLTLLVVSVGLLSGFLLGALDNGFSSILQRIII